VAADVSKTVSRAQSEVRRQSSPGRNSQSHTFQLAFTLAVAGVLFCAAGLAGFDLGKRALLLAEDRWADGVIWWEIYFGIGFTVGAVHFGKTADRIARRGK
jgi:hypothetical protein